MTNAYPSIRAIPGIRVAATALAVGLCYSAAFASAGTCTNTCVTMAIPRTEGVETRLDGTADAMLWPPTRELRRIRVAALNNRGKSCDVTIDEVLQDEEASRGADDAVRCDNEGDESTVELRSAREDAGDGRLYRIRFLLADPDCGKAAKRDDLAIVVPLDERATTSLKAVENETPLASSHASSTLQCSPPQRDARLD